MRNSLTSASVGPAGHQTVSVVRQSGDRSRARLEIEPHHSGTNIGSSDVHRQQGVESVKHPCGGEMDRADQARFVGMTVDRCKLDGDVFPFQDHGRPAGDQFADVARTETAPDRSALGVPPVLQLKKGLNNECELL